MTGFGSSYYHLNPNDSTLFWDRLPMTLCFAAILAAVVEERVDAKAGAMLLRPLLAIGIFSLLLWRWTDDLRLYAWAQFFPFLALVLILQLFPPKYTGASYWVIAAALYALAKLLEYYDEQIFSIGLYCERTYAQASRCGGRRFRNPETFPECAGQSTASCRTTNSILTYRICYDPIAAADPIEITLERICLQGRWDTERKSWGSLSGSGKWSVQNVSLERRHRSGDHRLCRLRRNCGQPPSHAWLARSSARRRALSRAAELDTVAIILYQIYLKFLPSGYLHEFDVTKDFRRRASAYGRWT